MTEYLLIGYAIFGAAIGVITGMSITDGTAKKAMSGLFAVIAGGGVIGLVNDINQMGAILGLLAFGYILGVLGGVLLRQHFGMVLHYETGGRE